MTQDSARISPTAYYTAQTWVRLGLPHAELFSTRRGRALVVLYRLLERLTGTADGESLLVRTLKNRHATLDEAVLACAPDRVVELGAGLSPRGISLAADHGIDCVDVDLPAMIARKRALVARHASPVLSASLADRWRTVVLDVTAADLADRLAELLAGSVRPVIVAEGLIAYFDPPTKLQILGAIRRALADVPAATCLFDVRIREPGAAAGHRTLGLGIRIVTRGRGSPPGFPDAAAALELWRRAGFTRAELLPLRDTADPPVLSRILRATP